MFYGLRLLFAVAVTVMLVGSASAAPADKPSTVAASVVTAAPVLTSANVALQQELAGAPQADERIVVAQRVRRGGRGVVVRRSRGGRGAGVAAGVALGILGAAAIANSSRAAPYYRGPSRCERWDRLCYSGEGWACRRLRREC